MRSGVGYGDFSLVVFDDTVADGKAQSGSLTHLLGGKKRVKNLIRNFLRNSAAGIRNQQFYKIMSVTLHLHFYRKVH